MSEIDKAGHFTLGTRAVRCLGYGAMQLAGQGVFGPPEDRAGAIAVLRTALDHGIDHIDTSDFYGPHVTNQIIREALHPYPGDLVIVTKVGARRGDDGAWMPALAPHELTQAVHGNLRNLGLDAPNILPIPGTSSVTHLHENLKAVDLTLSRETVAALDRIAEGR